MNSESLNPKPDVELLIRTMGNLPFSGPKGEDIRFMKIEREGRIIIIANTDRRSAQALVEEQFGLRSSASRLTRFTGLLNETGAGSETLGQYQIDHEFFISASEDLTVQEKGGKAEDSDIKNFKLSIDKNEMFIIRQEWPHKYGPSSYIRTIDEDRPGFRLSYRQIMFAYASSILNNADNDGLGLESDLPQGFHAILPLLHEGDLLNWGKGWDVTIGAAADFVLQLFLWPSDPANSVEATMTQGNEIVLFYEKDEEAWEEFVGLIENRFEIPVIDENGPVLDLLDDISGVLDEHSFLQNIPNVETNPLPMADLSPSYGPAILYELQDEILLEVSDWSRIIIGDDTSPPANIFQWQNISVSDINSFVANLTIAEQAISEIEVVEISEEHWAYKFKEMGYRDSNSHENKAKLWLILLRAFSHLQVARFYCASFKDARSPSETPTLGSISISYSGYSREEPSSEQQTEILYSPDLHDRPLSSLVDFIMRNRGENFSGTVEDLRSRGIRGDDRMVVYEHIIQEFEEGLEKEAILSLVPFEAIRRELEIRVPNAKRYDFSERGKAVQDLLFNGFGYPNISETRPDVLSLKDKYQRISEELPYKDPKKCMSTGIEITREMEWYLRICIKGAIREFAKSEDISETMKRLTGSDRYLLTKRSLGQLVNTDLGAIIQKYLPEETHFKQSLRDKVVSSRNAFGHPDEEAPHLSLDEANKKLQIYIDSCLKFVSLLNDSQLPTPIPIVIKSVKSTKHGYFEIEAVSSSGNETIYIPLVGNTEMEPGDRWYLIPHSNPIRIEPLLFGE